jgi:hypothetical protein
MKIFYSTVLVVSFVIVVATIHLVDAFVPSTAITSCKTTTTLFSSSTESEAERLLRRARELRQQAAAAEADVHASLTLKKSQKQQHLDALIETVLTGDPQTAFARLQEKHVSMETMEQMMDRLDDRLAIAEGHEHITVELQKVKQPRNERDVALLQKKIQTLLDAVALLDAEFRRTHGNKVVGGVAGADSDGSGSLLYSVSSVEASHWGGGHAHATLEQRLHETQRAREEQFQKRQQEFYEAQRIKKDKQAPPKVKDDHGFLP